MVGNEDDQNQYVLAMLLPSNMPWSEEEPGVSFWDWFAKVFSPDDSWELWGFLDVDVPLVQEHEYVTAYPTKANSHPLMKHQNGFDAAATSNSASTVSCTVSVPVLGGYPEPTPEITRPRPSQSMPQPRQTLRAPSLAPSACQSREAILGRHPRTPRSTRSATPTAE